MKKSKINYWTTGEVNFLREHIHVICVPEIAKRLKRTVSSVRGMVVRLGLKSGLSTEFKKGLNPWNKDKKGLTGVNKTSFQTGHVPHNTIEGVGHIRRREDHGTTRLWIKLDNNKWVLYSRYTYERHNGPIPAGHVIRHKDGNTLNCAVENLEMISRAENATMNQNAKKAGETRSKAWDKARRMKRYGIKMDNWYYKRVVNIY